MKSRDKSPDSQTRRNLLLGTGAAATGAALGFGGNIVARQFDVDSYRDWKDYEQYEATPRCGRRGDGQARPGDAQEYIHAADGLGGVHDVQGGGWRDACQVRAGCP